MLTQNKHNLVKTISIIIIMGIINTGIFLLINSFFSIINILSNSFHRQEALIIFYAAVYIPVILNGILIYHLPNWVDSWVKGKGRWCLENTIAYYQDILDRDEVEPQKLKDIYKEGLPRVEKKIRKALMGEKNKELLKKVEGVKK